MMALILAAILPILGLGDSIMAGYCNPVPTQTQFGYLVAKHYGTTFQDLGQNGYLAEDILNKELPLATGNYSAVLISVGTNDMNDRFNKTGVSSMAFLIEENIKVHQYIRAHWPAAKIVDVGPQDTGYLESSYSSATKQELAAMIGDYVSAIQSYDNSQTGMGYLDRFPAVAQYPYEQTYLSYYAAPDMCGNEHPSAAGEPAIANGIESILSTL